MTINTNLSRVQYNGNGVTTAFAFANRVTDAALLKVTRTIIATGANTVLILNDPGADGYSVAGVPGSSVTVNTIAAPATGTRVTIEYNIPLTQTADYVANDPFPAETHEGALDKLTIITQQQADAIVRSLKFPNTASTALVAELPLAPVADTVLAWDGITGKVKNGPTTVDISSAGANAAAAAASAAAAAASASTIGGFDLSGTPAANDGILWDTGVSKFVRKTAAQLATALSTYLALPKDFRLTLTSGTPVTTSDVTAASTIYCTPYKGDLISLYDGTKWNTRRSAEFSIALSGLTSARPYDVFCYDNAGVPTLELLSWTNDSTRGTALTYQNGIPVKSGDATRRYLGSFYTTSASTTEDSLSKRFLWNYNNRVEKFMNAYDSSDQWSYTTATIRQADGSVSNQLDMMIGVSEDTVSADVVASARNTNIGVEIAVGIGLDSTTAFTVRCLSPRTITKVANTEEQMAASWLGFLNAGRHYLTWLEYSAATGTTTWIGDAGAPTRIQSGIQGTLKC